MMKLKDSATACATTPGSTPQVLFPGEVRVNNGEAVR